MTARKPKAELTKAQIWRRDHGRTDGQDTGLIKAVREADYGTDTLTDAEIIEAIGHADTGAGAIKKVRTWLRDRAEDQAAAQDGTAGDAAA
jgi:hypothetical protein